MRTRYALSVALALYAWGSATHICGPRMRLPLHLLPQTQPLAVTTTRGVVVEHYEDDTVYAVVVHFPDGISCLLARHGSPEDLR